ncbi:MAG: helix-turn-helix domain-containing protein, partial [Selenomonadaceae bacterium]|nr:helix-turn-helix domain-containing protein [Selenomonadaceae bacterium]
MIKSFKIKLLPNNKQRSRLFQFAGAARFAYNWVLDKQMNNFKNGIKLKNNYELRKE